MYPTGLDNMGLRKGHGDHSRCDHPKIQRKLSGLLLFVITHTLHFVVCMMLGAL